MRSSRGSLRHNFTILYLYGGLGENKYNERAEGAKYLCIFS